MTVPENTPSQAHSLKGDSFVSGSLDDSEISLLDIVNFLADSWKKLVAAALAGALLGLGFWFLVASYQVSINLRNLASEILEKKQAPEGKVDLYRSMSGPQFWTKALTPVFSLTKADIKDLGAEVKDANNSILFLVIKGSGASKDSATQNAASITEFFRQGGAYMAIRDLFSTQRADFLGAQARIESKVNATLIELEYQKARLRSLEELGKRFPVESRSTIQAFDPKDPGAKYLPINTQIIAINTDINNNNEFLSRLKDQQAQQDQIKLWLERSGELIDKSYNGLELNSQLLALEAKFRGEIKSADPKAFAFVDALRTSLLSYEARFRWGLVLDGTPAATKSGMLKPIVGGLAGALVLMLLFLLGQRVWSNVKSGGPKWRLEPNR